MSEPRIGNEFHPRRVALRSSVEWIERALDEAHSTMYSALQAIEAGEIQAARSILERAHRAHKLTTEA